MDRFTLPVPTEVGDKYASLLVGPESIARRASSSRVHREVLSLCERLENDAYTTYVSAFYRKGMEVAGDDWGFMDIVTVLYAAAELGQPESYMEIGVRRGRSACAVATPSPHTNIVAVDMWQTGYAGNENPGEALVGPELEGCGHTGSVRYVNGDSHVVVPQLFADEPELGFDMITVDGDHSLEGAWADLCTVAPRLRTGGVIVFDDTANPYCPGLQAVWEAFVQADGGLVAHAYNDLGAGVSFAVRRRPSEIDLSAQVSKPPRAMLRQARQQGA